MAAHLARLGTIILVVGGHVMAGSSEETLQRVKRDDSDESSSSSASKCPCTQGCCEEGWLQYRDACYKAVLQKKTWDQAEEHCVAQASHLASVHSFEEDNFILHVMGYTKLKFYWLGAKKVRQNEELHWTWIDQSPFLYTSPRILPAHNERQIHFTASRADDRGDIIWLHRDGTEQHRFICKYFLV